MKNRGMLFTLAAIVLGSVVFTFAVAHNQISKSYAAGSRVLAMEKVAGQNANVEYNVQRTYKAATGDSFEETPDEVTLLGSLPANHTLYSQGIARLKDLTGSALPETTIVVESATWPTTISPVDVNFTHVGDETLDVMLPDTTTNITINAVYEGVINSCPNKSLLTAGSVNISYAFDGSAGLSCRHTGWIDLSSSGILLEVNGNNITMNVHNNIFTLYNKLNKLEYNITVGINETRAMRPVVVDGSVSTVIGPVRKIGVIRIP